QRVLSDAVRREVLRGGLHHSGVALEDPAEPGLQRAHGREVGGRLDLVGAGCEVDALGRGRPQDALRPGVGVLDVRRGVAVEREGLVPAEVDDAARLALEHAEAQRADAHYPRYRLDVGQAGVLLLHHGPGAAYRLAQHLVDRERDALAAAHRLTLERDDLVGQVMGVVVRPPALLRIGEGQR